MTVQNVVGLLVSGLYVAVVLGVSRAFAQKGMSPEGTRKLVHIALGGWWLIAAYFFTSPWWAVVLPALFIVVNAYAYRSRKLEFMARDLGEDTPGTVYYAVSLALLALFSFGIGLPYVGALGVLCMSFGDGLAAVIGKRFGRQTLSVAAGQKSLVGSVTMFAISLVTCAALLAAPAPFGAGLADVSRDAGGFVLLGILADVGPVAGTLLTASVLAAVATMLELFSGDGLDNLTVPLGVSALYAVVFLPAATYTPVFVGVLMSGVITLVSLRLHLLTLAAGLGAVIVGTLAFWLGGWALWLLLMWFFASSNIASRIAVRYTLQRRMQGVRTGNVGPMDQGREKQPQIRSRKKHEPRKLRQVLANSIPFLACAIAYAVLGNPWLLVVSAGALAASTADTWASEVGVYSAKPPVSILTRKPMQRGLSGGVSTLGLGATVVGSVVTALLAMLLFSVGGYSVPTGLDAFALVAIAGVVGSLVDSVLGARIQAKYRSGDEAILVEVPPAGGLACSALVSGYAWVTNDAVNFMSGTVVVVMGLLLVG